MLPRPTDVGSPNATTRTASSGKAPLTDAPINVNAATSTSGAAAPQIKVVVAIAPTSNVTTITGRVPKRSLTRPPNGPAITEPTT